MRSSIIQITLGSILLMITPAVGYAQQYISPISLIWPAKGPLISGYDGSKNKGIQISGAIGDPVVAAANGQIVFADNTLAGYGNLIIIKHDNVYLTAYGFNNKLLVKRGDFVQQGQKIAEVGRYEGFASGLLFEVRENGKSQDPMLFLDLNNRDNKNVNNPEPKGNLDVYREKCKNLGFKSGTEGFGKCVLQLSK
jgi:murein DD-endopeptidase MepM/ murein hydrolase activator NlpD